MSNQLAKSILQNQGLGGGMVSEGNQSSRLVYPAIVISNEDPLGMKRIIARIISLDDNGNPSGGRDRDTPTESLPFCVPMIPNHFHIVPLVDEMVYIILENPSDNSAPRYYIGSQINSPFKLKFQSYEEANRVFKNTEFNLNKNQDATLSSTEIFPRIGDIALQGRTDADLILRPREVFLVAGKFKKGTTDLNTNNPSNFQLIQKENTAENESGDKLIQSYSQANLTSSNINIYSVLGKFRAAGIAGFELNENLKSFGETANALHPAVFGDELIKLLDLIVRVLLNHIHTPQLPLVLSPESDELSAYSVKGDLQRIISNHIRIN
jgi:hypothetical protein